MFLVQRIRRFEPRFICVIHSKVRNALKRHQDIIKDRLNYGMCGPVLRDSRSVFVVNYFSNGNSVSDERKLKIFRDLRDAL